MAAGVPRKKKGESVVAYHDRLAEMIHGAEEAGDTKLSHALQRKAGQLAHDYPRVAESHRRQAKRSGPGTYPWYMCVDEQMGKGKGREAANAICGRIRANSRLRYPEYWAKREGYSSAKKRESEAQARSKKRRAAGAQANPLGVAAGLATLGMHAGTMAATQGLAHALAANPAGDGVPFCALGLDGGPRMEGARDNVVVVDRSGTVLEMREIHDARDLARLSADYPGLPIFGPLHVLTSDVRSLRRAAEGPRVERRAR
jgi:hypothetical protein